MRSSASIAIVAVLEVGLTGCMMPKSPGELVGAYHVDGDLTENTCGRTALPAPDHMSFDVELRRSQSQGYWLRGNPPAQNGTFDASGNFDFDISNSYGVPGAQAMNASAGEIDPLQLDPLQLADPTLIDRMDQAAQAATNACQLTVEETVQGKLRRALLALASSSDADSGPDLSADNEIDISGAAGADCTRVLATQGGPFEELPCHAHYDLTGALNSK